MVYSFRELSAYMGKRAPYLLARKGIQIALGLAVFAVLTRVLSKEEFAKALDWFIELLED